MTTILGRLGFVFGIIFLSSILDLTVSGYMEPRGEFRTVAGEARLVSGNLPARISSMDELVFSSDSPVMEMEFLEAEGTMWRGRLHAQPSIRDGELRFKVHLKNADQPKIPEYTLRVYHDSSAYRSGSYSLYERYLGVPPGWTILIGFPILLLSLALSYRSSVQKEAILNRRGMATVFKVNRRKDGCEISFGIGLRDGLREGEFLELLNSERQPVGKVKVKNAREQHATAEVDPRLTVKPNFLVAKYS